MIVIVSTVIPGNVFACAWCIRHIPHTDVRYDCDSCDSSVLGVLAVEVNPRLIFTGYSVANLDLEVLSFA